MIIVGIYRITGPGRVYVGSSDNIPRRWKTHRAQLRGNRHHNYRLQAAWNEHGEAAFSWEVVQVVADIAGLVTAEQSSLDAAMRSGPVYNLALDVRTPAYGLVHTTESRLKMSAAARAALTPELLAGRSKRMQGSGNPGSKLTEPIVLDICQRLMAGGHPVEVAVEFEVNESTVYQIRSGRIWTHIVTPQAVGTMMAVRQNGWDKRTVTDQHRERFSAVGRANKGRPNSALCREVNSRRSRGEGNPKAKLTEAKVAEIKWLLADGARNKDLAASYGVSLNTIHRIKSGESWAHVQPAPPLTT
jgi:hypothetical protein